MDTTTVINSNQLEYKNNEFSKVFASVFIATLFLSFIMWRWYKMREEINRAVDDFNETQIVFNSNSCSNRNQTTNQQVYYSNDQHKLLKNEPPPPYDTISKSVSLPNYNSIIEADNNRK
jgi:hypothetical protein